MIARIIHLSPDKNKLLLEHNVHSVKEHRPENKINNRTVYNTLAQICKDTDMYPYVKKHMSKRDGRGAYYAIYSKWLGPDHVSMMASEAEAVLLT